MESTRRFYRGRSQLCQRVITDVAAIEIPEECSIESDEFTHAIVFRWSGLAGCG